MGFFSRAPSKAELAGERTVNVNGGKYVIRKLNPMIDFGASNMPQIFTAYQSRRPKDAAQETPETKARAVRDMYAVIEAGLIKPSLVPVGKGELRGKEDGITVEDLFRDPSTGARLYWEIVSHSLNRFRGLKGVFFSIRQSYALFIASRRSTASAQVQSPSVPVSSV